MKSNIRIDFRGVDGPKSEQFEPVIRVRLEDSDDVRDGLLKAFFNSMTEDDSHYSNWLIADFVRQGGTNRKEVTDIIISPVRPDQFQDTLDNINSRVEYKKELDSKNIVTE